MVRCVTNEQYEEWDVELKGTAEIAQDNSPKSTISKKRSLFRSPGTASSPDLATLVKKAKDRGPVSHVDMRPDNTARSASISSNGGLATISERRGSQEKVRFTTPMHPANGES